jgi:hypothetical protein
MSLLLLEGPIFEGARPTRAQENRDPDARMALIGAKKSYDRRFVAPHYQANGAFLHPASAMLLA